MLIAVPREIKNHEYRVGLTPSSRRDLVAAGAVCIAYEPCAEVAQSLGYASVDADSFV